MSLHFKSLQLELKAASSCRAEFEPSEILLNTTEYWELLKGWLDPVSTVPAKWKLCYRATDHGWSSGTFHSRCNSMGPTVTFVRVGEYIFGGYTDRNWRK